MEDVNRLKKLTTHQKYAGDISNKNDEKIEIG
jgi:hypothetical protein